MRLSLLTMFCLLISCQMNKRLSYCSTLVNVVDLRNLDGCGLILEKKDGQRLLPLNLKEFSFAADEALAISYIEQDGVNACMAEQQMVLLTCVHRLSPLSCQPIDQIEPDDWLGEVLSKDMPSQINRYEFEVQYIYQVISGDGEKWFDCQGKLICESAGDCQIDRSHLGKKIEVYVAHR